MLFSSPVFRMKAAQTAAMAGSVAVGFVAFRSFCYRPAQKKSNDDLLVTVDRSGGGV